MLMQTFHRSQTWISTVYNDVCVYLFQEFKGLVAWHPMLNNLKRLEICNGSTQRIRSTIISLSGAPFMEHLGVYVNLGKSRRRSIQATKRDRESSGRALLRLMDSYICKGPMKVETTIGKYAKRRRSLKFFFIADSRDSDLSGVWWKWFLYTTRRNFGNPKCSWCSHQNLGSLRYR